MKQLLIEKNTLIENLSGHEFNITAKQAGLKGFQPFESKIISLVSEVKILTNGEHGIRFDAAPYMAMKGLMLAGGVYDGLTITLYLKNTTADLIELQDHDVLAVASFYEKIAYRQVEQTIRNGVIDLNSLQPETTPKGKSRRRAPKKKDQPAV